MQIDKCFFIIELIDFVYQFDYKGKSVMELHQLRYTVQVAKHLNFTKAANELCITQPTLSHQISRLENEIGVVLFHRKTRSVKATPVGETFVLHAKKILDELETLQNVIEDYKSFNTGTIRIGILSTPIVPELTNHILAFRKAYPGIHLQIIEAAGSFDLIKLLQDGHIDIAYLIPLDYKEQSEKIYYYPLIKGTVVLITNKNHRFVNRKKFSLLEAAEESFILPPKSHSIYNIVFKACHASGFEPKIACECSQLNTVFNLVANGIGISFASSQIIKFSLPANLKVIQLEPPIERTVCLSVSKDLYQSPIISVFLKFMLTKNFESNVK